MLIQDDKTTCFQPISCVCSIKLPLSCTVQLAVTADLNNPTCRVVTALHDNCKVVVQIVILENIIASYLKGYKNHAALKLGQIILYIWVKWVTSSLRQAGQWVKS